MELAMSLRNIHTEFEGQIVHNQIDIDLYRGEVVVLLGASGCGKTTLMRGMVGLEPAVQGECIFGGVNLIGLGDDDWLPFRKKIAFAFQNGALFDGLTVFENCAFPVREHGLLNEEQIETRVMKLLKTLSLEEARDKFPADLSGGMQKRVGLARALISGPEVLLLDEPTAGLDPANVQAVIEIVRKLRDGGMTIIIVSHDREAILAMADRLILIEEGKVATAVKIEELSTPSGLRASKFLGVGEAHG